MSTLRENPDSPAAMRALHLLARRQSPEAGREIVRVLRESFGYEMPKLLESCRKLGEPLVPILAPLAGEHRPDRVLSLLSILEELPYPQTVSVLVSHFSSLYKTDQESLLHAIETLGDRSLIPLVKRHMRYEEPDEETFLLLCRLNEVEDPELDRIEQSIQQLQEEEREWAARLSQGKTLKQDLPIRLKLGCGNCGEKYSYKVREVVVDPEDSEMKTIYVSDGIVCKNCGAKDRYEVTPEAKWAIAGCLIGVMVANKDGKKEIPEGTVRFAEARVQGTPMLLRQATQHYEAHISQHPHRAEYHVGYGNVLLSVERTEEAKSCFEKAAELEPLAVEAHYAPVTRSALEFFPAQNFSGSRRNIGLNYSIRSGIPSVKSKRSWELQISKTQRRSGRSAETSLAPAAAERSTNTAASAIDNNSDHRFHIS